MHTYSYHLGTATKFTGVISREIFACCSCCCCCPWQPSQLVKIETRREEEGGCFSHKEYFFSPSPSSSAWLSSVIKTLQLKVTTNFWGPSTIYSYKRTNEQKVKRQKIFSSFSLCSFVLFGSFVRHLRSSASARVGIRRRLNFGAQPQLRNRIIPGGSNLFKYIR